jgi:site-specific recombinase XerD
MVDCGLRLSEVARARIDMIDLDSHLAIVLGKRKKQRQVPLSEATAQVIKEHLQQLKEADYAGPWLLPGMNPEKPTALRTIDDYVASLCRRLGIQPITPHHLRHYFATQMLSHGANLKATSSILGHSSTSTTANVYWHLVDQQEVIDQHSKYSPLQHHLKGAQCSKQE